MAYTETHCPLRIARGTPAADGDDDDVALHGDHEILRVHMTC
jgi:hypothetical protein